MIPLNQKNIFPIESPSSAALHPLYGGRQWWDMNTNN